MGRNDLGELAPITGQPSPGNHRGITGNHHRAAITGQPSGSAEESAHSHSAAMAEGGSGGAEALGAKRRGVLVFVTWQAGP